VKHGELLNEDANFMTFFAAFNTMWRMSTGESFNGIMHDLRIAPPYCSTTAGGTVDPSVGNCGIDGVSQLYFTMMFTCLNYIFVNLCMAIILDNFGDTAALADSEVKPEHLQDFKEAWEAEDPHGSNWILSVNLVKVLNKVPYPVGFKYIPMAHLHASSLRKHQNNFIQKLDLKVIDHKIQFQATRMALVKKVMPDPGKLDDRVMSVQELKNKQDKLEGQFLKNLKAHHVTRVDAGVVQRCPSGKTRVSDLWGVNHTSAAETIQAMFRQYKARHQVRRLKEIAKRVIAENRKKHEQEG